MPQPGMNGMEPAFGEAYGGHRSLLSPYPLAVSPLGGRTEYDQSVVLMLGSPATPRKRPFELLSDLVDDGVGLGEELPAERWDVSALDEMTRYAKPGLGGALASTEDAVLMGRWGRSLEEEEEEEEERRKRSRWSVPPPPSLLESGGGGAKAAAERGDGARGADGAAVRTVEVYLVAQEEEEVAAAALALAAEMEAGEEVEEEVAAGSTVEHRNEEHNYSLCTAERPAGRGGDSDTQTEEEEEEEEGRRPEEGETVRAEQESSGTRKEEEDEEDEDEEEDDELEEEEEDEEEGEEETAAEAELSSSSETECEAEPERPSGERPQKRRCFWEYRRARESESRRKAAGEVRWSLAWSSSTLPSTLYRREGKKGRRKPRKTDASDLTPNPQKLHNIGEQLQKLNAAIDGMGPVNDLPVLARARSRKEKNKLASRACRLKKKAQHEANKIKLWGLNQEYDNLLGALLKIKEVIRQRVESSEEEEPDERGMTQRLEDILKESSGPLVAGRTKDFVQRILGASGGAQGGVREPRPEGAEPMG